MEPEDIYTTKLFRISLFFDLPIDIQEEILFRLDFNSIRNLCYVANLSKHTGSILFSRTFSNGKIFWRKKTLIDFPDEYMKILEKYTNLKSSPSLIDFWRHNYIRFLRNAPKNLLNAASEGKTFEVQRLVNLGLSPHFQNYEGYTPLMSACYKGHVEIARFLLERGAHIESKDSYGYNALLEATKTKNFHITELLLRKGANPNVSTTSGATPLMWSSYLGCKKITKLLLDYDADVESRSKNGYTALMQAAKWGRVEVLELLLVNGAQPNIKNYYGYTALILASRQGNVEAVKTLLEHGANKSINETDPEIESALEIAQKWNHNSIVEILKEVEV